MIPNVVRIIESQERKENGIVVFRACFIEDIYYVSLKMVMEVSGKKGENICIRIFKYYQLFRYWITQFSKITLNIRSNSLQNPNS